MAERIVSPGVFTRETDLSFLPQGIGEIGAALVGQSIKGPAFVPTKVESFQEFQQVFGGLTEESYLPYTAQSYLEEASISQEFGVFFYEIIISILNFNLFLILGIIFILISFCFFIFSY